MDEQERVLRNEIREVIGMPDCIGCETQEDIIDGLLKRFHIIPKESGMLVRIISVKDKPEPNPRPDPGVSKTWGNPGD